MTQIPDEEIARLQISGLSGRLLHVPTKKDKKSKILLIYGVHSSLERMYTNARFLSRYGEVLLPDLPGIGGMDSFYLIDRQPDIDTYADYLYTFIKSQKLNEQKIRIVAMSYGFLVATRMFQKFPETAKNVDFIISYVGFGRSGDFAYPAIQNPINKTAMNIFSTKVGGAFVQRGAFNKLSLKGMFKIFSLFNPKYMHDEDSEKKEATAMEFDLWSKNDARTRFFVYRELGNFDLTKDAKQIDLHVYNLTVNSDQYFDSERVIKTLDKLYSKTTSYSLNSDLHAPSIIGSEDEVADMFPSQIKRILAK